MPRNSITINIALNTTKIIAIFALFAMIGLAIFFNDATVFIAGLPVVGTLLAIRDAFGREVRCPKQQKPQQS